MAILARRSRCDCCGHIYKLDRRRRYDVWLCEICAADHAVIDGDINCGRIKGWRHYCGWDRQRMWRYFADKLRRVHCGAFPFRG